MSEPQTYFPDGRKEGQRVFIGRDAWALVPDEDLLLWWEGEHIRITKIDYYPTNAHTGEVIDLDIYLDPESMAWEQAAQMADEED